MEKNNKKKATQRFLNSQFITLTSTLSLFLFLVFVACFELDTPWPDGGDECAQADGSYDRDEKFGGWIDEDGDGFDTRAEVLIEENVGTLSYSGSGRVISGAWNCPYTGQIYNNASDLDIDHFIPLKEAWESGACYWSQERREQFANNLSNADHLVAVYYSANRSKGSDDPANWLPENTSFIDEYIRTWISLKVAWDLTVDEAEYQFLLSNETYHGRTLSSELRKTVCFCE